MLPIYIGMFVGFVSIYSTRFFMVVQYSKKILKINENRWN